MKCWGFGGARDCTIPGVPDVKTTSTTPLPAEALRLLKGFRMRHLLLESGRGFATWIVAVILFVMPALALDRFLLLETPARITIAWIVLAAGLLTLILFVLRPLLRPWSLLRCARAIEKAEPALEGALLSLVELTGATPTQAAGCSAELLDSLRADTASRCPKVRLDKLLPARKTTRSILAASAVCLLPLAAALWDPEGLLQLSERLLRPGDELPRPTSVFFLADADRSVAGRGQEVIIAITIRRGAPGELVLQRRESRPGSDTGWSSTRLPYAGRGENSTEVIYRLKALASFDFRVRGGDYISPLKHVEVREPAAPRSFTITYHYPEYTARKKRTIRKSNGSISALRGSRADILLEADRELAEATIILGARRIRGRIEGDGAVFSGLEIKEDAEYRIELETPDGITSGAETTYSIRTLVDSPPRITILSPRTGELEVESNGSLQLRYRGEDDHGINSIELLLQTGKEMRVLPVFRETSADKRPELRDAAYSFSIGATGARPPETLALKLRVRDGIGGEGHSRELKLKVTWPGNSPEGPGWLPALRNLRRGVEELRGLWSLSEKAAASSEAAENVLTIRSFCSKLAGMCLETAGKPPLPAANRLALESAAFRLRSLARHEAEALWRAAAGLAEGGKRETQAAGEAWRRGNEEIDKLAGLLEAVVICEELEEAHETLRLAAHDCGLLSEEVRDSGSEELPAEGVRRLTTLIEEVLSCSAGVDRLRRSLEPSRSRLIAELEGSVRAMTSSLTAELALARKAAEEELPGELHAPLERAAEAFARRESSLGELHLAALMENREARRWKIPESELAELIEAVRAAWLEKKPRRALLSAARSVFARIAWRNESGRDFDYPDFESTALLGAVAELLERVLAKDIKTDGVARSAEGAGADAKEEGRVLVEGLARAAHELEPILWLGRSLQLVQWISAGEETLALQLEGLQGLQARRLALARRSQADIIECMNDLLLRLEAVDGAAAGIEGDSRSAAIESTRQGREAAEKALAALQAEPLDVPAAAEEIQHSASLLEDATGILEGLRKDHLARIAATALWLRSNRGNISERLARLAEGLENHGRVLKESATGSVISSEKGGELIVESLVSWSEEVRQAKKLAREIRQDADRRAEAGDDPDAVANLELVSTALLGIVAGPLANAGSNLRGALSTDRDDRELLLSSAAASVLEAGAEARKLAEALAILDSRELAELGGSELEDLVGKAAALAEAGSMDLELIAMRARLLLDAALRASRELSRRLGGLRSRADILAHLEAAAGRFSSSLERTMAGDAEGALALLVEGLTRMEQAVALAKKARSGARGRIEAPAAALDTGTKPAERSELSRELESARRELEKLLELEKLRKEASGLLEKLLAEEDNDPGQLAEAAAAQEELASGIENRVPATNLLIELVARIATLQKLGHATAEEARYLEEEARLALAAGAGVSLPDKLVEKEETVEQGIRELVDGFSRAGFKLSMLLPAIFKAYRKAAAATGPLNESIARAGKELGGGDTEAAVGSLAETNLQLGVFLTDLDEVRARAIEAIAEAEAGGRSAYSSLQSALKNSRQAAKLISGGKIDDARKKNAAAKAQLLLAGRAIRRQLENVVLPTGEEGALVSRLLEAEAARLGLIWQTATRGEQFEASSEDKARGLEDMAFPPAYRDLVRIYLRAIRK